MGAAMKLTTIIGTAIAAAGLAACGSSPATPTARPTPAPTPTPVPTPSTTPVPTPPLVVTSSVNGSGVQLTLIGEGGSVVTTVDDPGGVDGASYYVGTDAVYFIDGATVKAIARNGTVTDVGQVPQVKTTVTASDLEHNITFAVSPDQTTLVFGIPLAMWGDNGATTDHSQLWTEPMGGTAASATLLYDDPNNSDNGGEVLLPFGWNTIGIGVSETPEGLGGAGPFLNYKTFNAATFDLTTKQLTQPQQCPVSNLSGSVCVTPVSSSSFSSGLKVERSSGTTTLTMHPANAQYGAVHVSADGRYLAYGSYVGEFGSGYYETTVVDLNTDATVATLRNFTPAVWLADGRLVVSESDFTPGATWLLTPAFTSPQKISADPPTGALA
jgi:hypothetical protein